jgi:carbonic anhydrase/acetyltransferase-like protein (isoleucine patch superfamily)
MKLSEDGRKDCTSELRIIESYGDRRPDLPRDGEYWLAPFSVLIGAVTLGRHASVWHGATIRADNEPISIGEGTNVQENCVLHVDPGFPLFIGRDCTIGHGAILHGCQIGDGTVIGMGAIVLNGARIGSGCLIGAGALIKENTIVPKGSLVVGSPGEVKRSLDEVARAKLLLSAQTYRKKSTYFREANKGT